MISIISFLASVVFTSLNSARDKARVAHALQFDQSVNHAIGDVMTDSMEFENSIADEAEHLDHVSLPSGSISYVGSLRGKAGHFSGNTMIEILGVPSRFHYSDSYVISLWFRTTKSLDYQYIAYADWTFGPTWSIWGPMNDGRILFQVTGLNTPLNWTEVNAVYSKDDISLADGKWHHLLAERNFEARTVSLYIDGNLQGTNNDSISSLFEYSSDFDYIYIGAYGGGSGFVGDIDSFRVYKDHL